MSGEGIEAGSAREDVAVQGADRSPMGTERARGEDTLTERYHWMTIDPDGTMHGDMTGTSPAEMDRRMVIMQEVQSGRLVLADDHRGAVEALARVEGVYTRTMPGPRDALRDQVLEIIAVYRSAVGGQR